MAMWQGYQNIFRDTFNRNMNERKEYHKKYYLKHKDILNKRSKEFYMKNKKRINKYNKKNTLKWKQKHKTEIKIYYRKYNKTYYIGNKDKIKNKTKNYYLLNKEKIKQYFKQYHKKNKEEIKKKNKHKYRKTLKTWEGYIPKETNCQICGRKIYFNQNNINNAIHFDHKNGNSPIKIGPSLWLGRNKRTPKSEKKWNSYKFGMLCKKCNPFLPAKNRKEFLKKVIKYVFGGKF